MSIEQRSSLEGRLGPAQGVVGELPPVRDDDGRVAAALRNWSDQQLEDALDALDRDVERRWELYAAFAARAMTAEPKIGWPGAVRLYTFHATYRFTRQVNGRRSTVNDGPRHQWALILDCDLCELDGGAPAKPRPGYQFHSLRGSDLTQADLDHGFQLLVHSRPRVRRPVDMFGPGVGGEAWCWPDGDDPATCQLLAAFRDPATRAAWVGEDRDFWREILVRVE